jgi:hypothetical protein
LRAVVAAVIELPSPVPMMVNSDPPQSAALALIRAKCLRIRLVKGHFSAT